MTVVEKLRAYANAKGITYSKFEKSLGKANSYLTQVKNVSSDVLVTACAIYPDLSAEWLLRDRSVEENKPSTSAREEVLMKKLHEANNRITELEIELELMKNA